MPKKLTIIKGAAYLSALYLFPLLAWAQNFGLDDAATGAGLKSDITLAQKSGQIIGSLLSLVGVVFLILMIYGGITWMTAAGNEKQVEKAKHIIVYAIVGLIIILSAYTITAFLGGSLVG
jgi:lysylphosphatidylglycerol synthetase-like protein (DUF2156 family)